MVFEEGGGVSVSPAEDTPAFSGRSRSTEMETFLRRSRILPFADTILTQPWWSGTPTRTWERPQSSTRIRHIPS